MDIDFPGKVGKTAKYRLFMKKEKYQLSLSNCSKKLELSQRKGSSLLITSIYLLVHAISLFLCNILKYKSKSTFSAKSRSTCKSHKPGEATRHKTQCKQVATNSVWVFYCAFLCVWPFKIASGSFSPE